MPAADDAAQQVFQVQPAQTAERLGEMAQQGRQPTLGTKEALKRAYVDKIERQVAQEETAALASSPQGPTSGEAGRIDRASQVRLDGGSIRQVGGQVPGRVGLASLDFDLPQRGTTYFFTTPRGNVEISAWPVNSRLLKQLTNFAWL